MNDKDIKNGYESISISNLSKARVLNSIKSQTTSGRHHRYYFSSRRFAVVTCLIVMVLLVPTVVYAASNLIFSASVEQNGYELSVKVDGKGHNNDSSDRVVISECTSGGAVSGSVVEVHNSMQRKRYINVCADFGRDYVPENISIGGRYYYDYKYKGQFDTGKNFYFELINVDTDKGELWKQYNKSEIQEITINNHKAIIATTKPVTGTEYNSDYESYYTTDIYIFYEEYGYIIFIRGMQGLGKDGLVKKAEKLKISPCNDTSASNYEELSEFLKDIKKERWEPKMPEAENKVTAPIYHVGEEIKYSGKTYRIKDIKVSDKLTMIKRSDFDPSQFAESIPGLWKNDGALAKYTREKLKFGDGISEPEKRVVGKEKIQLKVVSVTLECSVECDLPDMQFYEETDGQLYDTSLYYQYNRPEFVLKSRSEFMPYYYRETEGGQSFYYRKNGEGKPGVYHIAYIIDEDLVDKMYLRLEGGSVMDSTDDKPRVKLI